MRAQHFYRHGKEICTTGGRTPHIKQRQCDSKEDTGKKRRHEAGAGIYRKMRENYIEKEGTDADGLEAFQKKFFADNLITQ